MGQSRDDESAARAGADRSGDVRAELAAANTRLRPAYAAQHLCPLGKRSGGPAAGGTDAAQHAAQRASGPGDRATWLGLAPRHVARAEHLAAHGGRRRRRGRRWRCRLPLGSRTGWPGHRTAARSLTSSRSLADAVAAAGLAPRLRWGLRAGPSTRAGVRAAAAAAAAMAAAAAAAAAELEELEAAAVRGASARRAFC